MYYQYYTDRWCSNLGFETPYVIDECFETPNDNNVLEYALGQWVEEGESVSLSFHGRNSSCTNTPTGGNTYEYDLEVCVDHGSWGSELVSAFEYHEVYYQWFDDNSCDDTCDDSEIYVIGRCFETTNEWGNWVFARALWADEGVVELAFFGRDASCTTITEGPWTYHLEICDLFGDFAERMSETYMECNTGGLSFWSIFFIIFSIVFVCMVCFSCLRNRQRMSRMSSYQYQQAPNSYQPPPQQQNVVYAQQAPPAYHNNQGYN